MMKTILTLLLLILSTVLLNAATFTVTNTNGDVSVGSLRRAVSYANENPGDDVIDFNVSGTIVLEGTPIISSNIEALGPGADLLTIDGNGTYQGFIIDDATAHISGLKIFNCFSGAFGGGIYQGDGRITLEDCVISNCRANHQGGGAYLKNGPHQINRVLFSNNFSGLRGGALFLFARDGNIDINNSTFYGNNTNRQGGAIFADVDLDYKLIITNCTITENHCDWDNDGTGDGGGVAFNGNIITSIFHLKNSIIANNYKGVGVGTLDDYYFFGGLGGNRDEGNNLLSEDSDGNFNNPATIEGVDPMLAPPAYNGGTTPTCALLAGSPCIDAGTSVQGAHPAPIPATDQRGWARAGNGTDYDIGAYEYISRDGDGDGDGILSEIELQAPNGGDANGDGVLDCDQGFVASLPADDGWIVIVGGGGGTTYLVTNPFNTVFNGLEESVFPLGITGYRISGAEGFSTVVRIYFFEDFDFSDISGFKAYIKTPPDYAVYEWREVPNPATSEYGIVATGETTIGGESCFYVDLRLTDNAFGDSNPIAGIIDDPIAPFVAAASVAAIGKFGGAALIVSLLALGGWIIVKRLA